MKKQRQFITDKKIIIYEQTYSLPIFKNARLKRLQKTIHERLRLIKEGGYYHSLLGKVLRRKRKINQQEILSEIQSLIQDYSLFIHGLETYQESYYNFLLIFSENLKQLFTQKHQALKLLNYECVKLEIKNYDNPQIINELRKERQENFRSTVLLGKTSFLMLEKIKLLGEGVKKLAEDTQRQKQTVQQIIEELEIYQELNDFKVRSQQVRQEIAELVQNTIEFENNFQGYITPFQSLVDEVIKVDEKFFETVNEIKKLIDHICQPQLELLSSQNSQDISQFFDNFMVTSYEKADRLKDAFSKSQLLNGQPSRLEFSHQFIPLEQTINQLSDYLFAQFAEQPEFRTIRSVIFASERSDFYHIEAEKKEPKQLTISQTVLSSNNLNNSSINDDYTKLQNLLRDAKWQEADIETTKLLLKAIGKNYWHEVCQEDINNFPCPTLKGIDQLWIEYSNGYFGFSIQQSIWNAIGGQKDYETEKKLGERLGWRKDGNWLRYEELMFNLSEDTPIGHLPANWLIYDQQIASLFPTSSETIDAVGEWRVGSWLLWQMHLFLSRVNTCYSEKAKVKSKL